MSHTPRTDAKRKVIDMALEEGSTTLYHALDEMMFHAEQLERELNNQWQPISTAPKDGTEILASGLDNGCGPQRHYAMAWWYPNSSIRIVSMTFACDYPGTTPRHLKPWIIF